VVEGVEGGGKMRVRVPENVGTGVWNAGPTTCRKPTCVLPGSCASIRQQQAHQGAGIVCSQPPLPMSHPTWIMSRASSLLRVISFSCRTQHGAGHNTARHSTAVCCWRQTAHESKPCSCHASPQVLCQADKGCRQGLRQGAPPAATCPCQGCTKYLVSAQGPRIRVTWSLVDECMCSRA
jgi:hypothetical protein